MSVTAGLSDLAEAVDGRAREATDDDAVDGVPARWVAEPESVEQASALLRTAAELGLTVVPRGQGTALDWGAPPRSADLVVSTARLNRLVEHEAGDLVCVVEAGATIDAVNAAVAEHGQQLALDQPVPGSSVGGAMSTTRSGPRRLLYGTPRDQVLGATMVRADGTVATSGSKVVKNVAGYDVAKLLGGAYGTLGLVCRLVVRLHPLPRARRWLTATFDDEATAAAAARHVVASQTAPSAIEVRRDARTSAGVDVLVLLEGTDHGVDQRSEQVRSLLGAQETQELPLSDADRLAVLSAGTTDTVVKVTTTIPGVQGVLTAARTAESRHQVGCRVQGSAGAGVLYAVVDAADASPEAVAATVRDLRGAAVGGAAVALRTSREVRALVDTWGPVPGLDLMRRVKDEFDPEHRFAPGRYVGGI